MRLLLFDIDGTLICSSQAGRNCLLAALEAVFGVAGPSERYRMGGKTDALIVTELMRAAGIREEEIHGRLNEVFDHMTAHGPTYFRPRSLQPAPGVLSLLAALSVRKDVLLGLLTGNTSQTAPLKLAAAGIDPGQFRVGAYGSDASDRNRLPALAMARAEKVTGRSFTGENTVIIGDTPADILCARAGGAKAVAVASGGHASPTLAMHQPDYLLESLSDTGAVLNILLTP